ncbi:MAG: hypothetical protein U0L49_05105, partial [Eubacterium sp.]|nr:hypothetical protein [Eubacterium sp.]
THQSCRISIAPLARLNATSVFARLISIGSYQKLEFCFAINKAIFLRKVVGDKVPFTVEK